MSLFDKNNGWLPPDENEEKQHGRKRKCTDCGQRLLDKCANCNQFIDDTKVDEEDLCQTCGQELSSEDGESEGEEGFEEQKDGTLRKICGCCRRKCKSCPECDQEYDSDQDASEVEEDSEQEESEDTDSQEADTEESADSTSEDKSGSESSDSRGSKRRRTNSY